MLDDIMFFFDKNFGRVNNLLDLYVSLNQGKKGRKPTHNLDLLRATVVLMHSTLEDYLRSILFWKMPQASQAVISKIPLVGQDRKTKFDLGELSLHLGKTSDEIIRESVKEYLNRQSFNDTNDLASALNDIGLTVTPEIESCFSSLQEMIRRRHKIVHEADREIDIVGSGNHRIRSISLKTVIKWKLVVDKFVSKVNRQLF